jgi:hypothetical protein
MTTGANRRSSGTRSFPRVLWLTIAIVSTIASYHAGYDRANLKHVLARRASVVTVEEIAKKTEEVAAPVLEVLTPAISGSSLYLTKGKEIFLNTAKSMKPVTDKVTKHRYQIMYGRFLLPYYEQNPTMKMLEIGLGCDMDYGPGASTVIWKKLFPKADLWEAEFDASCVEKHKDDKLKGFSILTGDQGNDTVLDSWIEKSGGNFDVVIDDGGHQNCQIWHSFLKLWPTVKPGGLYFIEDLQVSNWPKYKNFTTDTCDNNLVVTEKLKEYIDVMIHSDQREEFAKSDIEFIFCQHEACVVGKKE